MSDLTTTYLGLTLKNPLVPSASPLSRKLDMLRRMEDAGAGAVVLYSLFEEQILHESLAIDQYLSRNVESYAEALTYFPEAQQYTLSPDQYLEHVRQAKAAVDIPVIASLNGISRGYWTRYAREIEQAGADALELNIYFIPTEDDVPAESVERVYLELAREVRSQVKIPIAVKLSPYFTNMAFFAKQLVATGINGLVLFNRFYQPDIDLDVLEILAKPHLSSSFEPQALLLPLRWIAILSSKLDVDFAATTGVHNAHDVLKLLLVGAKVTMLASELLVNGVERIGAIRTELDHWLEAHEYESVEQMRGSMSYRKVSNPTAFERAQYMRAITTFDTHDYLRQHAFI